MIHRANPALRQTDRVLAILARQNRVLGRLAVDSDRALAPLAREKQHLAGFIVHAGDTAAATAERRGDIRLGIARLPRFLSELRPLMADLGDFSGQATPVATDLNRSGADVSRVIERLGPFAPGAQPSLVSLGAALRTGRPAVLRTRPLVQDVGRFAKEAKPLSSNLDALTASFDQTGGIEKLMDSIYYSALAINGYDNRGHYQRANLLNNLCSTYQIGTQEGCSARLHGHGLGLVQQRRGGRDRVVLAHRGPGHAGRRLGQAPQPARRDPGRPAGRPGQEGRGAHPAPGRRQGVPLEAATPPSTTCWGTTDGAASTRPACRRAPCWWAR